MRTCSVRGCNLVHVAKGYCGGHYVRWKRGASLSAPVQKRTPYTCTEAECRDPAYQSGLCLRHLHVKRYGYVRSAKEISAEAWGRRLRVLAFIASHIATHGRPPGSGTIGREVLGIHSPSAAPNAWTHVRALIANGYLTVTRKYRLGQTKPVALTGKGLLALAIIGGRPA